MHEQIGDKVILHDDVEMVPCTNYTIFHDNHQSSVDNLIQHHVDQNQFFCPKNTDLTIWGEKREYNHKLLDLIVEKCDASSTTCPDDLEEWFDSKSLMLLINNRHADYDADRRDPEIKQYTDMHWAPISLATPMESKVDFVRNDMVLP